MEGAQPGGVDVEAVPPDHGVERQAEGAELVFRGCYRKTAETGRVRPDLHVTLDVPGEVPRNFPKMSVLRRRLHLSGRYDGPLLTNPVRNDGSDLYGPGMNSASANISGPWLEQLTGAFEILLGRPLASFDADAVYATFFGGNLVNELGFAQDAAWVNPAALRGVEPVV